MIRWLFSTLIVWAFLTFLLLPQFPGVWNYLPHIQAFPSATVMIASAIISAICITVFGD